VKFLQSLRHIAVALTLLSSSTALGQTSADPGEIERRIEQLRPEPERAVPPGVVVPTRPEAPVGKDGISFVLTGVVIEGATTITPAALAPLYAEFLAREVGRAELEEITARIAKRYEDAGYFLTRAVIPVQDVQGGVVSVRVTEGYIAAVRFEGASAQETLLNSYRARFTQERPVRLATVERAVLLINNLPGVTVNDVQVAAQDDAGAYELVVVAGYDSTAGNVFLDNRGTPEVGRQQAFGSLAFNSILGMGEQIQLSMATVPNDTSELVYGQIAVRQAVGTHGTQVGTSLSGSAIEAGGALESQSTESRSLTVAGDISHPVLLSREQALTLRVKAEVRHITEERFNTETMDDRIRVVRGQIDYALQDGLQGTNFIVLEASQGLDILAATEASDSNRSRNDADGSFTKFKLDAVRLQQIWGPFSLRLAGQGQVSLDPLLSSEEFLLGGGQFGRAYDFGEISGEDGVAGSAELRIGDNPDLDFLSRYEFYGFYDRGTLWDRSAASGEGHETLSSAGGGIRLTVTPNLQTSFEAAKPLNRAAESTGDKGVRVFFSLSAQF
jgi:hemolysin activation/secretion protein